MFEYSKSQGKTVDLEKIRHFKHKLGLFMTNPQFKSSSMFHSTYALRWTQQISLLPINVWVFIAQFVEHSSANAQAMGLNPVEVSG